VTSTTDVLREPIRVQFEAFLDEHRAALRQCLDGLTEEQARRSLVSSRTTLLGLVKHATFVEQVWFDETRASPAQVAVTPIAAPMRNVAAAAAAPSSS
jgi:Protein of unknown function (DUF664)